MKTFFNNHPNLTFILCGIMYVYSCWSAVWFLNDERWGWAAFMAAGTLAWAYWVGVWYRKTGD